MTVSAPRWLNHVSKTMFVDLKGKMEKEKRVTKFSKSECPADHQTTERGASRYDEI